MRWLLVLVFVPTMAVAGPFCKAIEEFAGAATSGIEANFDLPNAPVEPQCNRTLELGGIKAVTCGWAYPFRSESASDAFEDLLVAVESCGEAVGRDEALVSHPDSYDLRMFRIGAVDVSVSLKDKGALDQTWLFLRVGTN